LEVIHDQGIVHADLKPSNLLMVGRDNDLKLTDFGVSIRPKFTKLFFVKDKLKAFYRVQFLSLVRRHFALLQPWGFKRGALQSEDGHLGPRMHPISDDNGQARLRYL